MIVGATFTGVDIGEFVHAATIAVIGEVPLDAPLARRAQLPDAQRALAASPGEVRVVTPDEELVERLRAGDEAAFAELVARYHRLMLRVARVYVRTDAVAEEVVQESWLAVLRGIERFEGRSSFKTWLLRIVANRAMTQGVKEARSVPFASLEDDDPDEPSVSADQLPPGRRAGRRRVVGAAGAVARGPARWRTRRAA